MNVEFDIRLTWQDLFRFNMYQTYTGFHGLVSILIPLIVFVIAGVTAVNGAYGYAALYILGGLLVLGYVPFTLWTRAKSTMKKNEVLANPLHFRMTAKSIVVTQGEETGELPWGQVYKLISTKRQILIYSSRINAYIIPREQVADKYEALRALAAEQLPDYRIRMR